MGQKVVIGGGWGGWAGNLSVPTTECRDRGHGLRVGPYSRVVCGSWTVDGDTESSESKS